MIKIIGIDPGLAATGIGIIRGQGLKVYSYAFGSIPTKSSHSTAQRLNIIFSELNSLMLNESPDAMVIENVFSLGRHPKSGITLGKVMGVILLCAGQSSIPVYEISVREIKQVLTGNGNASKEQLETAVRNTVNHEARIRPFHASDALAAALVGLYRYQQPKRIP